MKSASSAKPVLSLSARRRLAAALSFFALMVALALDALCTETGARALWQIAIRLVPGSLSGELVGGTISSGVELRNVSYRDSGKLLRIDTLAARWSWSRAPLKLSVDALRIGTVDLMLYPTPSTPLVLPRQLTLPLEIALHDATLRQIVIRRDAVVTAISDIRLNASSDKVQHELTLNHANTPYGTVRATLNLNGMAPFGASGSARLDGAWRSEHYRIDANVGGTLQALELRLDATGDRLNGNARIEATPFEPMPLRRAQIGLRHLNPQLFNAGAPRADLDITADLVPSNGLSGAAQGAPGFAVAGPVALTNALAGPIDAGLLPLVTANADLRLDADRQQLSRLRIQLPRGALRGAGEMSQGARGYLALEADSLDPHALHTRLRPAQLGGPIRIDAENGTQRIGLKLSGASLALAADTRLSAQNIVLENALLETGAGRLKLSGTLARGGEHTFAVRGSLSDFNPAGLLARQPGNGAKSAGALPEARINADFGAQGAQLPQWRAQLQFKVSDSTYAGLPMYGEGRLRLNGTRALSGDARLTVAGNRVQLRGGFGAPPQRLNFNIDAPALARLGFGLSGQVQADGELGGTVERPMIDASIRAERLAYQEYRLAHLASQIRTQGVPGRNPDARVTLELDARDVQSGQITLSRLNVSINGTYAGHAIALAADGKMHGTPLSLDLSAQGSLRELAQGYGWDGELRKLENRGAPRLSLAQPLQVSVAPQRIILGATRMTLEQAQIDLKSLRLDEAQFSSEGSVTALDLGRVLELQREFGGGALPIKTDLVLDGRWKFALSGSAGGFFLLERTRGDVRIASGARETALGIKTLQLRGDLQGQALQIALDTAASRIGSVNGQAKAIFQRLPGRLWPTLDSPLSGRFTADIPRLQSIVSLAGPKIGFDGSIGMDLQASGTLGAPLLSGDILGRNLSLTVYDQGVRLHDGNAHIRLADNVVELRQFELRGGEGTVRATGRLPLSGDNLTLSATLVADRLQLLSKPSAQLTISGQASVASPGGPLEISGKVRADNARFQLPEKSAPALDDDVLIIRGKQRIASPSTGATVQAGGARAGPFTPLAAIDFDLGDDFRFEGSGADVLLGGTLAIASAPGEQSRASGTVRIVDGTYEAFGTKLTIERGLLNFHNSFSNPDVNILAMRRDKEVAAGVQVTGTVRQPRVQLVSEPEVPEEDKLSWLVFGRGGTSSDAGSGQAQAAAMEAARSLFNRVGGARIAKGFGLDQLAVGSSEFGLGAQQVVSLGKEISNRLYIGYEQSLAGASGVLKLTYDWTRHWSVVLRGGTIGGLDVLYNKRFDAGGDALGR
ncbi:translocation/assembly module TamB domain-containing protein [Noviherbaspirillum autotrophicum]|uniref:Signal peptide protein n=1 Tax=Noviherbaspirillum autotrophicum TaxID=709839 RepID=A0A0C1Y344_9BURK|nr:translocation/assembly module TamB domain-containing protein [Noviherbaspirillum autotrophicum]KIF81508.1 signal peptide protein [Noviherbaspirillum autotrophicum]